MVYWHRGNLGPIPAEAPTKEQARIINAAATANLGYLHRLRERMTKAGFPQNDPLLKLVENAYDATHPLFVALHHLSCDGVGRTSKADPESKGKADCP